MSNRLFSRPRHLSLLSVPALAVALSFAGLSPAAALDDPPAKPKIDCSKKANKDKPGCAKSLKPDAAYDAVAAAQMSDDELYNAAYWLARQGSYSEALGLLAAIRNQDTPRVQNATGFATRKLGDIEAALPHYARALALDPNYTRAREYLGEAHLSLGNVAAAKAELAQIANRCGTTCAGYPELASQIAAFEAAGRG